MLNNERKFPKREPVWKPLFDIFLLSLFFRPKKSRPSKTAHAELTLGAHPTRPKKSVLDHSLREYGWDRRIPMREEH
jgi:hypothetical protein